MRTLIVFLAGAVFAVALLTKCSVPNAIAGGGGDLPDAAGTSDGGSSGGRQPKLVEVACDGFYEDTETDTRSYYAVVHDSAIDPRKGTVVTAMLCDPECTSAYKGVPGCFGNLAEASFLGHSYCEGEMCPAFNQVPQSKCVPTQVKRIDTGTAWVRCGARGKGTGPDVFDIKAGTVIFRID